VAAGLPETETTCQHRSVRAVPLFGVRNPARWRGGARESFDVGVDLGSTVSLACFDRRPFAFDGRIESVKVELKQPALSAALPRRRCLGGCAARPR
jgi:hypothetical protein